VSRSDVARWVEDAALDTSREAYYGAVLAERCGIVRRAVDNLAAIGLGPDGQRMTADEHTPTRILAAEVERLMASAPGTEHDVADVQAMIPGMTATGARAAIVWLAAEGKIRETVGGFYSLKVPA
jgi:hypothetical protein